MPEISASAAALPPIVGNGQTVTVSTPLLDLSQTWNAAGVTFAAAKVNVTDTASATGSKLLDLQRNGVSQFTVGKFGNLLFNPSGGNACISAGVAGFDTIQFGATVSTGAFANGLFAIRGDTFVAVRGSGAYAFENGGDNPAGGTLDLFLRRDAANILAQRNGLVAQTGRTYNTYTDASNGEWGAIQFVANVLQIGAVANGTGITRNVAFMGNGFTFAATITQAAGNFNGSGYLQAAAASDIYWSGRSRMNAPADGIVQFGKNAGGGAQLTVASLPAASAALTGARAMVTDCSVTANGNFGANVTGVGVNVVPVYCDGTNWKIG
jgi:hypothetical protein